MTRIQNFRLANDFTGTRAEFLFSGFNWIVFLFSNFLNTSRVLFRGARTRGRRHPRFRRFVPPRLGRPDASCRPRFFPSVQFSARTVAVTRPSRFSVRVPRVPCWTTGARRARTWTSATNSGRTRAWRAGAWTRSARSSASVRRARFWTAPGAFA